MRRIFTTVIAFLVLSFSICTPIVFAEEQTNNDLSIENIISTNYAYYEDGSYDIIVLLQITNDNNSFPTRTTYSTTGSRIVTHYDNSHNKLYALKVTGTFLFNNSTVSCSNISYQTYIYNSEWTVENVSTSSSGSGTTKASATASGNGKKHFLGITIQTSSISATVYCDKDGNLS